MKDILDEDEVHDLVETSLEGSRDVYMHEKSPSLGFDNIVLRNPLNDTHVSPICLSRSPSPEYHIDVPNDNPVICDANNNLGYEDKAFSMFGGNVVNFMSLSYFSSGYNVSLGTHYMYLVGAQRKIM